MPGNPGSMVAGCDGGVFLTTNDLAVSNVQWVSLDNGYSTAQFYTTAIDHGTQGSSLLIGGMQDNNVAYTVNPDGSQPWNILSVGDGTAVAIANGGGYYYFASELGETWRQAMNSSGSPTGNQ